MEGQCTDGIKLQGRRSDFVVVLPIFWPNLRVGSAFNWAVKDVRKILIRSVWLLALAILFVHGACISGGTAGSARDDL